MSYSTLTGDQKLVTVFTVLTGLMHLLFFSQWLDDEALGMNLGYLFVINGLGYFVLLYLLYFGDQIADKNLVRYGLGAWTLGTILGWLLFHPGDLIDQSISNKVIEVLLLVFLIVSMMASYSTLSTGITRMVSLAG